ncbi:MAG TPA: cytosine deaminase [Prochlorococcaceae cyanobacterium AMR_MDS_5431]|nr:cytosine deaminase [Prochlorococcaceae cyanobacterium AMR_MDS_5431]
MQNSLAVQVPRDLLDPLIPDLPVIDPEGLVSIVLTWSRGQITDIKPFKHSDNISLPLAISPLLDCHTHVDKSYSNSIELRNYSISQSLLINTIEHSLRTRSILEKRINYSLHLAWCQGIRGIRTHVDTLSPTGQLTWEVLQDLRLQWADRLALQLVALAPLPYWITDKGFDTASKVARAGGLLGGILGPPYSKSLYAKDDVLKFLYLAQSLNCSVDLHIDESSTEPGAGVRLVTRIVEHCKFDISIACSHASSMGLLSTSDCRELSNRMAAVNLQVISLPWTNFWLLGRQEQATPVMRPIAPIYQLQTAGVNVSIGSDNMQDAWFPMGSFDIIKLMCFSIWVTHLTPWSRQGLSLFTTAPSRLMALEWDGVFCIGAPADILLFDCSTWQSLLSEFPRRRILRRGQWN